MRRLIFSFVYIAALFTGTSSAQQPTRVALVIGNMAYKVEVGPLKNPHNDIRLVGDALKGAGFEVMTPVRDATRVQVLAAVRGFAERLQKAGPEAIGFLYYSGHGAAIGSQNYLIPVDVEKSGAASLADGGVPHREIIDRLFETAPQAAHYLVIDACRNNLGGTKGPKGFRPEPRRDGMLIAFATSPDKAASDEGATSGPFAAALAAELMKPAKSDLDFFHRVRVAVDQGTNGEQVPWIEDGLRREERPMLGRAVDGDVIPNRRTLDIALTLRALDEAIRIAEAQPPRGTMSATSLTDAPHRSYRMPTDFLPALQKALELAEQQKEGWSNVIGRWFTRSPRKDIALQAALKLSISIYFAGGQPTVTQHTQLINRWRDNLHDAPHPDWLIRDAAVLQAVRGDLLESARLLRTIKDAYWRTNSPERIVETLAKLGRYSDARDVASQRVFSDEEASDLTIVVTVALGARAFAEAIKTAGAIKVFPSRAVNLSSIAVALDSVGRKQEGLTLLESVLSGDASDPDLAKRSVAQAFLCLFDSKELADRVLARTAPLLASLHDDKMRDAVATALFLCELRAGRMAHGLKRLRTEIVPRIEASDLEYRFWLLEGIVVMLMQHDYNVGDVVTRPLIRDIIRLLASNQKPSDDALSSLAKWHAVNGDVAAAMRTTEQLEPKWVRSNALRDVADVLVEKRKSAEAGEVLVRAASFYDPHLAAYSLARLRYFEAADAVARSINKADDRVRALAYIARELAEAGRTPEAMTRLDEILEFVQTLPANQRYDALEALGDTLTP